MTVYLLWIDALDPQMRHGNPYLFGIYATREAAKAAIPKTTIYHYLISRREVRA